MQVEAERKRGKGLLGGERELRGSATPGRPGLGRSHCGAGAPVKAPGLQRQKVLETRRSGMGHRVGLATGFHWGFFSLPSPRRPAPTTPQFRGDPLTLAAAAGEARATHLTAPR